MDYEKLARHLFQCHQNPLKKIELPSSKHFLKAPDDVGKMLEKYRKNIQESVEHTRVERRCARSKGYWINDLNLCKITKAVGILLKNFGFQDKTGIYLTPEETLYLLEQNRLELTYNNEQVSIAQAYAILTRNCTLKKYRVYKKLVMRGFKLLNKHAINKIYSNVKIPSQKRKLEHNSECTSEKIRKIEENSLNFAKIFEKLKQDGPQVVEVENTSKLPDYFGFLPASTSHRHDFKLYIRDEINVEDLGNYEDTPNVLAVCTNDNVAFYRFPCINLPNLY